MTQRQRQLRFAFWRSFFLALIVFTGWIVLSAIGGHITAEQPLTTYPR